MPSGIFTGDGEKEIAWLSEHGIPIRNLWFLLAYASGLAKFIEPVNVEIEDKAELPDILARLLAHVVERRLRGNLSRGYQDRAANLHRVRGRIDWLKTESGLLLSRGQIACRYQELTNDTPRNRLALIALMRISALLRGSNLTQRCSGLIRCLKDAGVAPINPSSVEVARDMSSRVDTDDALMVHVAELILHDVIPSEVHGYQKHHGLDRSETLLRRIFEKAITGFYVHELHGRDGWHVRGQTQLRWQTVGATDGIHSMLPVMQADMVFEKKLERRIILDTKFTNILNAKFRGGEGFKSAYLYQMYAYLKSQTGRSSALADNAEGILLHPTVDRPVDEAVTIQGHKIRFVTINLAAKPEDLRRSLLKIICE